MVEWRLFDTDAILKLFLAQHRNIDWLLCVQTKNQSESLAHVLPVKATCAVYNMQMVSANSYDYIHADFKLLEFH